MRAYRGGGEHGGQAGGSNHLKRVEKPYPSGLRAGFVARVGEQAGEAG